MDSLYVKLVMYNSKVSRE